MTTTSALPAHIEAILCGSVTALHTVEHKPLKTAQQSRIEEIQAQHAPVVLYESNTDAMRAIENPDYEIEVHDFSADSNQIDIDAS